jgi:hypothetical protein
MEGEPIASSLNNLIESTRFLKQMGRPGDDMQALDAIQPSKGVLIKLQNTGIRAADNQQGWRPNLRESITGEVRATPA